jgi:hypothetical protein
MNLSAARTSTFRPHHKPLMMDKDRLVRLWVSKFEIGRSVLDVRRFLLFRCAIDVARE